MKIEKAQKAKTEKEIKELDSESAEIVSTGKGVLKDEEEAAKDVASKQVRKVADEDLQKTMDELDELAKSQEELLVKLRENAHDTAAETLDGVEKTAAEKAAEAAQAAIDKRMEEFHAQSRAIQNQSSYMHNRSEQLMNVSLTASNRAYEAIRIAQKAAEDLPKAQSDKATLHAKDAVKLSKALKEQAKLTKELSKTAEQMASLANNIIKKTHVVATDAKHVAELAIEQSGKNAAVLKVLQKRADVAAAEAKDAAHRARVAAWETSGADVVYFSNKLADTGHPTAIRVTSPPPTTPLPPHLKGKGKKKNKKPLNMPKY